ncbi:MAG TPA: class I SAM-dependent methyltransferase [Gaiellaceae bacterium]|nr:class I SAM-dependent methyltransferase [Gaiellaceae bacterium]HYA08939.1 class I SAM-dependent methyltransferase [Gaiellaceae bacterium]
MPDRKQAEIDYPRAVGESGRNWIRLKPFASTPDETARLLIDFAHVVQLLELAPGMTLCELGCGSGWISRLAARHGVRAEGYDISPGMIEIAREQAAEEGLDVHYETGDMEQLDLGRRFDACLLYDALHHSPRPDLVLASARRALKAGGRVLLAEPNWTHRFGGRKAVGEFGVTELGYTPHRLKRSLRDQGFTDIRRFHPVRKRLPSNSPGDVALHVSSPLAYRVLAPFWTQIWLRARAT